MLFGESKNFFDLMTVNTYCIGTCHLQNEVSCGYCLCECKKSVSAMCLIVC